MTMESRANSPQLPIYLYPLRLDTVASVVKPVMEDDSQTWAEYIRLQRQIIEPENPYAFDYLSGLAEDLPEDAVEDYQSGVMLAYNVFRKKAGGKLPILTLEFVSGYQLKTVNRLTAVYGSPNSEGALREEEIRTSIFALLEKEAYQVLQDEVVDEGASIFDTPMISGFINSYFLYQEGFLDSMNWE